MNFSPAVLRQSIIFSFLLICMMFVYVQITLAQSEYSISAQSELSTSNEQLLYPNADEPIQANMGKMGLCTFIRCGGSTSEINFLRRIMSYLAITIVLVATIGIIIGGMFYIFDAGSESGADNGKSIIIASVIGLTMVFLSYLIITLLQAFVFSFNTGGQ